MSGLSETGPLCCSSADEDLHLRLQRLQSRFTWDLKEEDLDLEDLTRQLKNDIELHLDQRGIMAHSYSFLAFVRYLQHQPEETLKLLLQSEQKTREDHGEDSDLRLIVTYGDLAWLKYLTGDPTESQNYCQKVKNILEKHPTDSPDVLLQVYSEKAWTFLKFSRSYYPRAMDWFCRAIELQPDDCELNSGYAIALYRTETHALEPDTEESPGTKQLRRALELNPEDGMVLALLALKMLYQQKYSEAEGLVERALGVGADNHHVIRYVAKYLRKTDQLDESIDLLQRFLKRSHQSVFIHHQLALCYSRKKKNLYSNRNLSNRAEDEHHLRRLSIQHLEEVVRLKSTLNQAKADLALQYAEEHNIRRAQEMFDDVLEKLDEETLSIRQFICRCYAEFCYYHAFQKDLAVTYYKKALDFSKTPSEKKYCVKKLKMIAERRLNRNPKDAAAYGILGAAARAEGDQRRAELNYEKALAQDGNNAEYLSALRELRSTSRTTTVEDPHGPSFN